MRISKLGIVAVIAVVAILVVAYLAVIGYTTPVPDFKQNGGGNGFNTSTPGSYLAYSVLTIDYTIFPYTGTWSVDATGNAILSSALSVDITKVTPSVQPFVSMSQGRVYEHKTLQFASGGNEGGGGVSLVANYYIVVTITGPAGFSSQWSLSTRQWNGISDQSQTQHFEIQTGRCFFQSNGQYQVNVQFYQYVGTSVSPTLVVGGLSNFGVNV